MTTNFFSQLAALNLAGEINIRLTKGTGENYIATIWLNNEQCGDEAKKLIPPFKLTAPCKELGEKFFDLITQPMQQVSNLMLDMETFQKQLEQVKAQSAMEKEKAAKEKTEKEVKEKKYKEAMSKANELEKEGKFREAWTMVPDPTDYPEYAETLKKRKSELSAQFAPSLFNE